MSEEETDVSRTLRGIGLLLLMVAVTGCGRTPQVLEDEAVFKELDALFTALNSKKVDLVAECRSRLAKLHEQQRLSAAGYTSIDRIAERGEGGEWQPAAEELYAFIRAQRKPRS